MTNLSKCLAVFAVVASLAFLGVVSVSAVGGKNYEAELDGREFSSYVVTKEEDSEGKVTYEVETRKKRLQDPANPASAFDIKKVNLKKKNVLPQVLIDTLTEEKNHQTTRLELLEARINGTTRNGRRIKGLKDKIKDAQAAIAVDAKAVQARISALNDAVAAKAKELADLNKKSATAQDEARKKAFEAVRRRQEIERLITQVEILKADKVRLDQQHAKLDVLIKQMQGEVNAAMERKRQLQQQTQSGGSTGGGAGAKAATTSTK